MKTVKLGDLSIEWRRGNGLRKADIVDDGSNACVLYGELFTKYKNVLINEDNLSRTNSPTGVMSRVGDVLVPGTSTAAKSDMVRARVLNKNDVLIGGDINIIRQTGIFEPKYLAYFFETDSAKKQLDGYITGTTGIIHISNSGIKNLKMPLLALEEQRRVVERLDAAFEKIDRAIELTEKNLKKSQQIFDLSLQDIITSDHPTWDKKTLKDISREFGRGKSKHRPRNDKKLYNGEYPFIQTGDIRNSGHYIIKYTQTYNDFGLAQSKLWPKGTICITIAANIAETGILSFAACFPDSVIGLVVDESQADGDYVEYVLQSLKTKLQSLGKGSAQDNINLGTFENEFFPFPNLSIQKEIVEKLNMLSNDTLALKNKYETKIAYLKALKQSLLTQAFSQSEVE